MQQLLEGQREVHPGEGAEVPVAAEPVSELPFLGGRLASVLLQSAISPLKDGNVSWPARYALTPVLRSQRAPSGCPLPMMVPRFRLRL